MIGEGTVVRMDNPGMVMISMSEGRIRNVTVSDPSRKSARLILTLPGNLKSEDDGVLSIPSDDGSATILIIDLPQGVYAGKSVRASF